MERPEGCPVDSEAVELDVSNPLFGRFRAKGYRTMDLVVVLEVVLLAVIAFQSWTHRSESQMAASLVVNAVEQLNQSQRYFACIIALPPDSRLPELQRGGFCDQVAARAKSGVQP